MAEKGINWVSQKPAFWLRICFILNIAAAASFFVLPPRANRQMGARGNDGADRALHINRLTLTAFPGRTTVVRPLPFAKHCSVSGNAHGLIQMGFFQPVPAAGTFRGRTRLDWPMDWLFHPRFPFLWPFQLSIAQNALIGFSPLHPLLDCSHAHFASGAGRCHSWDAKWRRETRRPAAAQEPTGGRPFGGWEAAD